MKANTANDVERGMMNDNPAPLDDHAAYRVVEPDGTIAVEGHAGLDDRTALESLRWMVLSRRFDARATLLQRQGRMGTMSPVIGQEASVVGSAMAFDPAIDWLVPQYRELPAYLIWGFPLAHHILNLTGNPVAGRVPVGVKMLPTQVALGAQLPHAVGLAWGLHTQHKPGVVVTYFGDGSTSEGDFHEACNLAGVTGAPVVFFLQNNQWAISTPRSYQSAAGHLADRAKGYGLEARIVDGNDLCAVYEVTRDAVQRARDGRGGTLIESITYRMSFHNTTDDPSRYQDPALLDYAEKFDPIDRVEAYLERRGLWDADAKRDMAAAADLAIDRAFAEAASAPAPRPSQIFDHVFDELTPRQQRQRHELLERG